MCDNTRDIAGNTFYCTGNLGTIRHHIHDMRKPTPDAQEPVNQDALRMYPRHQLTTPVLTPRALPST